MKHTGLVLLFWGLLTLCRAQPQAQRTFSPALHSLLKSKNTKDSIDVLLNLKDTSLLTQKRLTVLAQYAPTGSALVRLTPRQLDTLLKENQILFADARRTPKEELTTGALDISLNKINTTHYRFPKISGDSIFVSLKEQQFDTTDIDIMGRSFNSQVASPVQSSHASIMATILAGAGNSSPMAKGAAWGSILTSSNFATLLPDPDSIYLNYHLSVQNHSYGTAIENYYGGDAAAYDQTVLNQPSLVHVFSAGNLGNTASSAGPYSGLPGYANLTGSFKMGKNNLVVGATDSFNRVVLLSSKGPAYDGRVKPELVAFGEDGSSGAAALVSGGVALVQQAFRTNRGRTLPSQALVKAILLNSADDVERPGIDFASGYGALNAYEAVKTVIQNRYRQESVRQDERKEWTIQIPAGIRRAKFTLSWTDPPAAPNAPKALVNDLDSELSHPATSETWLPWVLSSANHIDSVLLPARRRRDTLNNTEQITLNDPAAGDYLIRVKGSRVLSGTDQAFALAYQLDTADRFEWTYPTSSDALKASNAHLVRWQTTMRGTASLAYSLDGIDWQTIATNVNLEDRLFQWTTPDTTASGFLRMQPLGQPSFVSDTFTISHTIGLKVGFNCEDSFLFYWNKIPAAGYQVYQLGEKYLEPVSMVTDTLVLLPKNQHPSLYYSVSPLVQGKPGFRSFTINYTTQGVGCYLRNFLVSMQNNRALLDIQLGSVYGLQSIQVVRKNGAGTTLVQTIESPTTTAFTISDADLRSGANFYQLVLTLANGQVVTSPSEVVYYFPVQPVILYPNPAAQHTPIRVIAQTPGEFSLAAYDATGRLVTRRFLDDTVQELSPLRLAKGLYIVIITDSKGNRFAQKLLVY